MSSINCFKIFMGEYEKDDGYIEEGYYTPLPSENNRSKRNFINLAPSSSGEWDSNDVRYIYGYRYTADTTEKQRQSFRKYLECSQVLTKSRESVRIFIDNGVLNLLLFNKFGALVDVVEEGTNPLVEEIRAILFNYTDNNSFPFISLEVVEECSEVTVPETERQKYIRSLLQGVNVLTFTDFGIDEARAAEVLRTLQAIHPDNTLTVFVLVKE